jgi:hypothetical protein
MFFPGTHDIPETRYCDLDSRDHENLCLMMSPAENLRTARVTRIEPKPRPSVPREKTRMTSLGRDCDFADKVGLVGGLQRLFAKVDND